jgi:hypothetical protein
MYILDAYRLQVRLSNTVVPESLTQLVFETADFIQLGVPIRYLRRCDDCTISAHDDD